MTPAPDSPTPLLEVNDLTVRLHHGSDTQVILEGVSYSVMPATSVAIVGESGAGKSVSTRAVLALLDMRRFEVEGSIRLCGVELATMKPKERRAYVASVASLVFQDPTRSLNPTMRVGLQIAEAMRFTRHRKALSKEEARQASIQLMRDVGIADPEERFHAYPHQLSGGMRQRVVIAIALSCEPQIVFCDEPTSSLDVTTQALIMDLLDGLRQRLGISIVLITHDLSLASSRVSSVLVMYSGRIVERIPADELFEGASMPYTRALLRSVPDPGDSAIRAPLAPSLARRGAGGCLYHVRCERAEHRCSLEEPKLVEVDDEHAYRCFFPGAYDGPGRDETVEAVLQ